MLNHFGHDCRNFRTADLVTRGGKKSHPVTIQVLSANLQKVATDPRERWRLKAVDKLNPSGNRQRTEGLEMIVLVLQILTAKWYQVASMRCAKPDMELGILEIPTVKSIANQISNTPEWKKQSPGKLVSEHQVSSAIQKLVKTGYINRAEQSAYESKEKPGKWVGIPSMITFTQKLFVDLCGGVHAWNRAKKSMQFYRDSIQNKEVTKRKQQGKTTQKKHITLLMKKYFNPGKIVSPKIANMLRDQLKLKPNNSPPVLAG